MEGANWRSANVLPKPDAAETTPTSGREAARREEHATRAPRTKTASDARTPEWQEDKP